MIKILAGKKGITLIELIVGMLVFTIIAVSATTILVPIITVYSKANDLAESNTLLDNLSDEILSDLWRASEVEILGTRLTISTNINTVIYDIGTVDNVGLLCRIDDTGALPVEIPVLDRGYYKGKTVGLGYFEEDQVTEITLASPTGTPIPSKFIVRINIFSSEGTVMATRDYAVNPLGLNSYDT